MEGWSISPCRYSAPAGYDMDFHTDSLSQYYKVYGILGMDFRIVMQADEPPDLTGVWGSAHTEAVRRRFPWIPAPLKLAVDP